MEINITSWGNKGISKAVLEPNGTIRGGFIFSSLSPISHPVELTYQYSNNSSLVLDIDPVSGLCPYGKALMNGSECNCMEEPLPIPPAWRGSLKSSIGRLDEASGNAVRNSARKERGEL